ncbi:DUF935 family protein [Tenacibaculum maritimum]|nr:DUF935 family protein [Tenacibaculum maritimum]
MTTEIEINGTLLQESNPVELSKKAQNVVLDLVRQSHSVYRKEINDWQRARMARQSKVNPRTYLQQQMYADAMLDTHLSAVAENRVLRIQNKRFVITDDKGITNPDKSQYISKKWFADCIRYLMESILYEFSLIQLVKEGNEIVGSRSIPRGHVLPDKGLVLKNVYDEKGLDITAFPDDLLFAKLYDGYGLLEKAAPLTILKRHSWASWDEFEQVFGMPIRIAKLGSMNDDIKNEVASWLETMGTASYGVFPQFADIEIKEANNRDAFNVFFKKIEAVDSQNSILLNGQTMTVQDGSSHSQATVHQKTEGEITEADLKGCLYWANDVLLPAMRRIGYPIAENESIGVERVTNPIEKIITDEKLMQNGYRLSDAYIERVYGVELAEAPKTVDTEKKS